MALTRDTILQAELHRERVETPEWARMASENGDAHVWVREMRGDELDAFLRMQGKDEVALTIGLCITCVCDEGGNPLFAPEDASKLGGGPLAPLQRCATTAMRLNGLLGEDAEGNA
jgi:hypothetical protein